MGIVSIKTISPASQLGLWKMTEPWEELALMLDLPVSEIEKLETIAKHKRKQEWLACRLLLKEMMGQYIPVEYNAERKPHLKDSGRELSMSHSGEYACVYLGGQEPVGVDIQQLKPSISKGAFYFLNDTELKWADLTDNVQMHLIWSAKESVFKYAGDTAVDLKKHITVSPFSGNQNDRFEVCLERDNAMETVRIQFETFDDYVLTLTI